ncbi:hypothetical protein [Microbacterium sp. AR7-10]|uniref:hypothetical protein n=1 Tax=Microbacterium sp. AR7-10 TaxID=1891970 RepID=UPI0015A71940|nr:hypothetical protein [Microbacterium sp. AR7-10]
MHIRHIAMQASSIDIMTGAVMPCIRSIVRIIVPHMSAQFMHATLQSIICVEQTVHACSHAAHASMHACMTAMSIISMPEVFISDAIASIIIESMVRTALVIGVTPGAAGGAGRPACGQGTPARPTRRWRE